MPEHPYLWHPIFVHFTVALLATSVVLFAVAWRVRHPDWHSRLASAAELNLWIGTALTALTVAFGWIAFDTVPHDDAVHDLMVRHRNLALITFAGFAAMTAISIWQRKRSTSPSAPFVLGMLLALAGLGATGLLGGRLVFEHGLGVERSDLSQRGQQAVPASQPEAKPAEPKAGNHHHDHPHK